MQKSGDPKSSCGNESTSEKHKNRGIKFIEKQYIWAAKAHSEQNYWEEQIERNIEKYFSFAIKIKWH